MTPYEQLRTRINELLPDRIELAFGIEFQYSYHHYLNSKSYTVIAKSGIVTETRDAKNFSGILRGNKNIRRFQIGFDDVAILGKPLTIEDVLRALGAANDADMPRAYLLSHYGVLAALPPLPKGGEPLFNLRFPLSAPENEAACAAVLKLLTV